MLTLDGPPLSQADCFCGLFLIDATWRYAALIQRQMAPCFPDIIPRSIPSHFRTAYPRRQTDCSHPDQGLASIEALYIAYQILGFDTTGLLDHYYWRDQFLERNCIN